MEIFTGGVYKKRKRLYIHTNVKPAIRRKRFYSALTIYKLETIILKEFKHIFYYDF